MKRKRLFQSILVCIGFLFLVLDSKTALTGAQAGVTLCIETVIPSMFPFMVLSTVFLGTMSGTSSSFLHIIAAQLGIPTGAEGILIPAFLGGYPIGAQSVGLLYQREIISKTDAERLLAFCNNAGPSFLFGMVSCFFPQKRMIWYLWMIHITGALLTAAVLPAQRPSKIADTAIQFPARQAGMLQASRAMASICSWVILFRIATAFLNKWILGLLPNPLQVLFTGFLELTNGCCELASISDPGLRFVICSCMLAFGGICVFAQTASVTSGLSLNVFFFGKILQTLFSFLLSCAVVVPNGIIYAASTLVFAMILRKVQKRYSIPDKHPV